MTPSPDLTPWEERALTAQVLMHAFEARLVETHLNCTACGRAQKWMLPGDKIALGLMAPVRCWSCGKAALRDIYGAEVFAKEAASAAEGVGT